MDTEPEATSEFEMAGIAEEVVSVSDAEADEADASAQDAEDAEADESDKADWAAEAVPADEADQASDTAMTQEVSPTPSQIAEVFAPDSEETREQNFQKMREICDTLSRITAQLGRSTSEGEAGMTPRGEGASDMGGGDSAGEDSEMEEEAAAAEPGFQPGEDLDSFLNRKGLSQEEAARLFDLMLDQEKHLRSLLASAASASGQDAASRVPTASGQDGAPATGTAAASGQGDRLLELIIGQGANWEPSALQMLASMRPGVICEIRDTVGFTVLHHAVKAKSLALVFAILQKVPDLANVPSYATRTPARQGICCLIFVCLICLNCL